MHKHSDAPDDRSSPKSGHASLRFASAGTELAATVIVFAAIGYWLDRYLGNASPVATGFAATLGFAAGMYRFIRLAMAVNRSYELERRKQRAKH